MTLCVDD